MFDNLLEKALWHIVSLFPQRTKIIETDGEPYLLRFYLKHNGMLPGLYLHKFYRGDIDRDLHNHPWKWSLSFILTGGYAEERLVNDKFINTRFVRPGSFNFIKGSTFHRVHLTKPKVGAWTLFCSGPEVQDWGFLLRDTFEFVPHDQYLS